MKRKLILTVLALGSFGLTKVVFNLAAIRAGGLGKVWLADFNIAFSYCSLLVVFYGQVFGSLSNKFVSEHVGAGRDGDARRLHTGLLVLVGLLALAAFAVSFAMRDALAGRLRVADTALFTAVLPYAALYAFYFYLKYAYYSFDRVAAYCLNEIVSCAMFFCVLAAAAATGSRALATQSFNIASALFIAVALWQLRDRWLWHGALQALGRQARAMMHFGAHVWVNHMTGFGVWHASILVIGHTAASAAVKAEYSALLNCLTPLNLFPMAVSTLLLPAFARNYGAPADADAANRRLVAAGEMSISLVMVPVFLLGAVLAPEWVSLLVQSDSAAVRAAFLILLASFAVRFHTVPVANYLTATRHVDLMAYISVASACVALGVWWIAVPRWHVAGAAAGNLALIVSAGGMIVWAMRRRAAVEWFRFGPRLWAPPLILALGAVAAGWVFPVGWPRVLAGVAAAAVYVWPHRAAAAALAAGLRRGRA